MINFRSRVSVVILRLANCAKPSQQIPQSCCCSVQFFKVLFANGKLEAGRKEKQNRSTKRSVCLLERRKVPQTIWCVDWTGFVNRVNTQGWPAGNLCESKQAFSIIGTPGEGKGREGREWCWSGLPANQIWSGSGLSLSFQLESSVGVRGVTRMRGSLGKDGIWMEYNTEKERERETHSSLQ